MPSFVGDHEKPPSYCECGGAEDEVGLSEEVEEEAGWRLQSVWIIIKEIN